VENIVVVEIEKALPLRGWLIGTPYTPAVWLYVLWSTYSKSLPFMADSDAAYNSIPFDLTNVYVDFAPYKLVASFADCINEEGSYFLDGPDLFVHFVNHLPPFVALSILYGRIYGFTNTGVRRYRNTLYLPEVESVPGLSEAVDPIKYSRMAFASAWAALTGPALSTAFWRFETSQLSRKVCT